MTLIKPLFAICAVAALTSPIQAAEVRDCDTFEANARNLSFPIEEATRSYANGAISLINLFMDEPVCCGGHLMVLLPSADEGFLDCRLISRANSLGYAGIDLTGATASYDPAQGLLIAVPTQIYNGDSTDPGVLDLVVNQGKGTVQASDR